MRTEINFKYILIGFLTIAIGNFFMEIVALFKDIEVLGWINIAIYILGWISIVLGTYKIRQNRIEFKRSFIIAICGIVFVIVEALLAVNGIRKGLVDEVFLSMGVMFFEYLSNLCILGMYFLVIKGVGQLMAKRGDVESGITGIKIAKVAIGVILTTMILIPFAYMLKSSITFIIGGISIGASLVAQLIMINSIRRFSKEA